MRSLVPSCKSTRPSPDQDPARLVKSADCALSEGADKLRAAAKAPPASAYAHGLFGCDCMVSYLVCVAATLASALAGALVFIPISRCYAVADDFSELQIGNSRYR